MFYIIIDETEFHQNAAGELYNAGTAENPKVKKWAQSTSPIYDAQNVYRRGSGKVALKLEKETTDLADKTLHLKDYVDAHFKNIQSEGLLPNYNKNFPIS